MPVWLNSFIGRKIVAKEPKVVSYATPALDKGLDVIELLAGQTEGMTKSQLARALNRTVSEIFRMLLTLEQRGYIAQVGDDRYSLTLKMFKLVQEHPPTERLLASALQVMQRLAHQTLQSCHLGVLETSRVVILSQVNAPTDVGFYVKPGSTVDLMAAASGYVILAHQKEDQRERTLADWMRDTGKALPRDLNSHLSRICNAGYEKRESYLVKGVVNISFPVLDDRGSALGALTVPYIRALGGVAMDDVIKPLGAAAAEITAAIGGSVP